MKVATVGFLLRGEGDSQQVALGERDSLFCDGILNGVGGKIEPRDRGSLLRCLYREGSEEWGIDIDLGSTTHLATVDFHHFYPKGYKPECDWRVSFYTVLEWKGEPKPIQGFKRIGWYPWNNLPFSSMMCDQAHWLPIVRRLVLEEKFSAHKVQVFYGNKAMTKVRKCEIGDPILPMRSLIKTRKER